MMSVIKRLNKVMNDWAGIITIVSWCIPLIGTGVSYIGWDSISYSRHPYLYLVVIAFATVFSITLLMRRYVRFRSRQIINKLRSIGELGPHIKFDVNAKKAAKKNIPILIVDDREAMVIKKQIAQFEYQTVSTAQQLPSDNQLEKYVILITDIDGVGEKRGSDGLDFALNFKAHHPIMQIVLISAYFHNIDSENVKQAERILDGTFVKGDSYDKEMRTILERCVERLGDPKYVWEQTREVMFKQGTPIAKIALYENEYVTQVEKVFENNNRHLPYDWLRAVAQGIDSDIRETMCTLGANELIRHTVARQ